MSHIIDEVYKEELINILTSKLKMLRAEIGISQKELATRLGVSRQTYGAIENKEQKMTWSNFLALLLLFRSNEKAVKVIDWIGVYPPELEQYIKLNRLKDNSI